MLWVPVVFCVWAWSRALQTQFRVGNALVPSKCVRQLKLNGAPKPIDICAQAVDLGCAVLGDCSHPLVATAVTGKQTTISMPYLSVFLTLSTAHFTEMAMMTREHEAKQSLLMQELRAPLAFLSNTSTPAQPTAHTLLHLRAGVAAVRVLVASLCSQLSSATAHIEVRVPPRATAPFFCCHAHEQDSEASAHAEIQLGQWGTVSMQEVISICMGSKAMANRWRPMVQNLLDLSLRLVQQLQALQHDHAALVSSTATGAPSNAATGTTAATTAGGTVNASNAESNDAQPGAATTIVTLTEVVEAATACLNPQIPISRSHSTLTRILRSVLGDIEYALRSVLATAEFRGGGGVASCVTSLATMLAIPMDEHDAISGDSVTKDKGDNSEDDSDEDEDEDDIASVLETLREDMASQQTLYHMSINPSHSRVRFVQMFKLYALARGNHPNTDSGIAAAKWTQTVSTRLLGHGHTYTLTVAYEVLRLQGLMLEDKTAYETMEEEKQLRELLKVLFYSCMKLKCWINFLENFQEQG